MADSIVSNAPPTTDAKRGRPKSVKPVTVAKTSPKVKQPKAKSAAHPPTSEMVDAAITTLNEKGGSSLHAIKKFISSKYKLDSSKSGIFIKKYLVNSVVAGKLVQTKGTGATGSFKFQGKDKPAKKTPSKGKKTTTKKVAVTKKAKTTSTPTKPKPKMLKATKPKKALKTPKTGTRKAPKRN